MELFKQLYRYNFKKLHSVLCPNKSKKRIEHYEISAYGTARTFAKELGLNEIAVLLQETLDEEANADKALT